MQNTTLLTVAKTALTAAAEMGELESTMNRMTANERKVDAAVAEEFSIEHYRSLPEYDPETIEWCARYIKVDNKIGKLTEMAEQFDVPYNTLKKRAQRKSLFIQQPPWG